MLYRSGTDASGEYNVDLVSLEKGPQLPAPASFGAGKVH